MAVLVDRYPPVVMGLVASAVAVAVEAVAALVHRLCSCPGTDSWPVAHLTAGQELDSLAAVAHILLERLHIVIDRRQVEQAGLGNLHRHIVAAVAYHTQAAAAVELVVDIHILPVLEVIQGIDHLQEAVHLKQNSHQLQNHRLVQHRLSSSFLQLQELVQLVVGRSLRLGPLDLVDHRYTVVADLPC